MPAQGFGEACRVDSWDVGSCADAPTVLQVTAVLRAVCFLATKVVDCSEQRGLVDAPCSGDGDQDGRLLFWLPRAAALVRTMPDGERPLPAPMPVTDHPTQPCLRQHQNRCMFICVHSAASIA